MSISKQAEIRRLLDEKNAILLVHYYQREEIQDIADFLGDSLALSIEAARTDAEIIVFAGVRFMAESASILSPNKTVLLPRPEAGCPLADMITPSQLREMKEKHPGAVVVTYVNSSAEVKAESDVCCTSANALDVVMSLDKDKEVIMVPDGNLARYTAKKSGRNIVAWNGFCPIHHNLRSETVLKVKEKHPGAVFAAHPECNGEVLDIADYVGSSSGILRYAASVDADKVIVGTEVGMLHPLRKQNPEKTFIPASEAMVCETMKYITLDDVLTSLLEMKFVVKVEDSVRLPAEKALSRMHDMSRNAGSK